MVQLDSVDGPMVQSVYEILLRLEGDQKARQGLESTSASAQQLGIALGAAGAALTGFTVLAENRAAEFEFALAKLQTVTGATADQQQEYAAGLKGVIEATGNAVTRTEALGPAYIAASAGIRDADTNLALLEGNIKLATAGFADQNDTLAATITAYKQYGDSLDPALSESEKLRFIQEQLILVQNEGNTTLGELASQYSRVVPGARAAGVSIEELNATIAASTALGLGTNQAITGINQAIASIARGGATAEGRALIEELGLSFNAAGLEAIGFTGVLQELANNGVTGTEQLLQLAGSTEAVSAISTLLSDDLKTLSGSVETFTGDVQGLDAAFETVTGTRTEQLGSTLNAIQEELTDIGAGVTEALTPILKLIQDVVQQFGKLPQPIKTAIGLGVAVNGVLLTLGGSILFLAGTFGSLLANSATTVAVLKQLTAGFTVAAASTTSYSAAATTAAVATGTLNPKLALAASGLSATGTSAAGASVSVKAFSASIAPVLVQLAALTAAVGAVTLAVKQYQNIESQFVSEDQLRRLRETEPLVTVVERAVARLRETGQALPEDEFNALVNTLEGAQAEVGGLASIIDTLKEAQQRATDGTLEQDSKLGGLSSTLDQATEATKELEVSQEDLATQLMDKSAAAIAEVQKALEDLQQSTANEVALGQISEEQALQQELVARREATSEIVRLERELARSSELSSEQQAQARTRATQALQADAAERTRILRELRQLESERFSNQIDQAIAQEQSLQAQRLQSEEQTSLNISALRQQQLQRTLQDLEVEIQAAGSNLNQRERLVTEYYRTEAALAQESDNQQRIIEQAREERQTQQLERLKARLQEVTELSALALNTQSLSVSGDAGILGGLSDLFADVENFEATNVTQALEDVKAAQDDINQSLEKGEAITDQQRQNLSQARTELVESKNAVEQQNAVLLQVASSFQQQGVISRQVRTVEEARVAIAEAQLRIKIQELEIQRQQVANTLRVQSIEQSILIQEQQALIASGTLAAEDQRLAQLRINSAQETISLLEQQAVIQQRNIDLELELLRAREAVNAAQGDPTAVRDFSGQSNQASRELQSRVDVTAQNAKEQRAALQQLQQLEQQGLDLQAQAQPQIISNLQTLQGQSKAGLDSQTRQSLESLRELASINSATAAQTQAVSSRLDTLNTGIQQLPGRIAAAVPQPVRPDPVAR